jgi:hypothetical protein
MWVMIAGPYWSGSRDPEVWAANPKKLNEAAVALQRAGHVPIIGVNMALRRSARKKLSSPPPDLF